MNTELQNQAWASLPKDLREEVRRMYKSEYVSDRGYQPTKVMECLTHLFGHHNLTSDTEPSELLFVERKKVQEIYDELNEILYYESYDPQICSAYLQALHLLEELFGNKFLPDKEPSIQGESKFKVGDLVLYRRKDICKIESIDNGEYPYLIRSKSGWVTWAAESDIEPYTEDSIMANSPQLEPETKDNTQQSSWNKLDAEFKRFDECCNKIRKTLESLCNSFDKMKNCIDRL